MLEESPPIAVVVYVGIIYLAGLYFLIHSLVTRSFLLPRSGGIAPWRLPPSDFALFLVVLLAVVFAVQVGLGSLLAPRLGADGPDSASGMLVFGTLFHLSCLGVFLGFRLYLPDRFRTPLSTIPLSWIAASAIAVYAFFALLPVHFLGTFAWMELLRAIGISPQHQDVVEIFRRIESPMLIAGMFLLVVVLAPISEEILFRGCLYRFLKNYISRMGAIAVSAILFSLMHQNFMGLFTLALLGALLCIVYERTGSLKAPILLHAVFNLNTVILLVLENAAD